jgi:two-component system chemotaxis response regulator CheB
LWRSGPDGEQFRCLVGHAYHLDSLLQGADLEIDRTVWAAIRLFEQRANISRMMGERERSHGRAQRAKFHESRADESHQHAQKLRQLHARRGTSRRE